MKTHRINRRQFLTTAASATFSLSILPRHLLGGTAQPPPSEKLNVVSIGCGGMGWVDIQNVRNDANIIGFADVDWGNAAGTFNEFPDVPRYKDFRKMLDDLDNKIDAVLVSTPDHTHAIAAMEAMRRGKHVHCQKPLAKSIYEVRQLQKAARHYNVVTQMGNQGHSFESMRHFAEWVSDGAIGEVHTIHAFSGHNWSRIDQLPALSQKHSVPDHLDWDLWQGSVPRRSYNPAYLPAAWRGWAPYGGGTLGDWGCHVLDPSFWALDLGAPKTIRSVSKQYSPEKHGDTFSPATQIEFEFPAKEGRGPVKLVWYDGDARPPRPVELEEGRDVPDVGAFVYGSKGVIMHGSHGGAGARIIPEVKMAEYQRPARTLPRIRGGHYKDWLDAIKEKRPAGSSFEYGGALSEIGLLGNIALRFNGEKLEWDSQAMRFTNRPEANAYVNPPLANGWSLEIDA